MPAQPPPEAALIAARLAARVPHMSRREAARRAGISETRWRQIENGIIRVRGADYPEVAPAGTLARIALVVGSEVDGLSPAVFALAEKILEIPMHGKKESLNVGVAFGIVAFGLRYR